MNYILSMTFITTSDSKCTLIVEDAISTLTQDQITAAMDTIISKNIFETSVGSLVSKHSVSITEESIKSFEFN